MIEAESFIEAARTRGIQHYSGVPCSFLTPFINYVINDESIISSNISWDRKRCRCNSPVEHI